MPRPGGLPGRGRAGRSAQGPFLGRERGEPLLVPDCLVDSWTIKIQVSPVSKTRGQGPSN